MLGGRGRSGRGWFSPTDSNRAADGVVQAAQVVHLAAFRGVMEGRGGEEAEVVGGARDVHRAGKGQSLSCRVGDVRFLCIQIEKELLKNCAKSKFFNQLFNFFIYNVFGVGEYLS